MHETRKAGGDAEAEVVQNQDQSRSNMCPPKRRLSLSISRRDVGKKKQDFFYFLFFLLAGILSVLDKKDHDTTLSNTCLASCSRRYGEENTISFISPYCSVVDNYKDHDTT